MSPSLSQNDDSVTLERPDIFEEDSVRPIEASQPKKATRAKKHTISAAVEGDAEHRALPVMYFEDLELDQNSVIVGYVRMEHARIDGDSRHLDYYILRQNEVNIVHTAWLVVPKCLGVQTKVCGPSSPAIALLLWQCQSA